METTVVSAQSKREYVQGIYQRYRRAGRPEKQRILDEFCKVSRYHRKHAIRVLNGPSDASFMTGQILSVAGGATVR
jgi:hypothetical protein